MGKEQNEIERLIDALLGFVERVAKGNVRNEAETAALPHVARTLSALLID